MDELLPVVLCCLFGAVIWRQTRGSIRLLSSVAVVAASGITASVVSGEYGESWIYVILDLGEAAFGLALGFALAGRVWPLLRGSRSNLSRTLFERSSRIG